MLYNDANNFYGSPSQYLPYGDCEFTNTVTIQDLIVKPDDFGNRYAVDVNLKNLDKIKNKRRYFPICPYYAEGSVKSFVRKITKLDRKLY